MTNGIKEKKYKFMRLKTSTHLKLAQKKLDTKSRSFDEVLNKLLNKDEPQTTPAGQNQK